MKKTILVFSLLIVSLLLLFQLSKYAMVSGNFKTEIIIAVIAIVFFFVGVYLNKKSLHKQIEISPEINHKKIEELEISKREYEVLQSISAGLSNKEIAKNYFFQKAL